MLWYIFAINKILRSGQNISHEGGSVWPLHPIFIYLLIYFCIWEGEWRISLNYLIRRNFAHEILIVGIRVLNESIYSWAIYISTRKIRSKFLGKLDTLMESTSSLLEHVRKIFIQFKHVLEHIFLKRLAILLVK